MLVYKSSTLPVEDRNEPFVWNVATCATSIFNASDSKLELNWHSEKWEFLEEEVGNIFPVGKLEPAVRVGRRQKRCPAISDIPKLWVIMECADEYGILWQSVSWLNAWQYKQASKCFGYLIGIILDTWSKSHLTARIITGYFFLTMKTR